MKQCIALICLLLCLALLLAACGGSTADSSVATGAPVSLSETDSPSAAAQTTQPAATESDDAQWENLIGMCRVGTVIPDFTTMTSDGEFYTLSEALQDHELALINLWATWCPPCNMEFPHLQEAYREYRKHVSVIALSVEETDSLDLIRQTAQAKGLTFPMGRDENYRIAMAFNVDSIPTSILVDRSRTVLWIGTGAMSAPEDFAELFDSFLPGGPLKPTYTVKVLDQDGKPVPGCVVNFCSDDACTPVTTDKDGSAVFRGLPYAYHVELLSLPEGYEYTGEEALTLPAEGGTLSVAVTKQE